MNIHFTDENLFNQLLEQTLFSCIIGSKMYGTDNEKSDTDILHIYVPTKEESNSFVKFQNHHQLQFKKDNVDYIFTDIFTFLKNLMSGDSTINFEVIHSETLKGTCLEFLYDLRKFFYSYNVLKAYLGFAKRDLKQVESQPSEYERRKKLFHAKRGIKFCNLILSDIQQLKTFEFDENLKRVLKLFFENFQKFDKSEITKIANAAEIIRKTESKIVNECLETKQIVRIMSPENQKILDNCLKQLVESDFYQSKIFDTLPDNLISLFYNVLETGLTYNKYSK